MYLIHPSWCFHKIPRVSHSRYSSTLYHRCALNRAPCREYQFRCKKSENNLCRHGCNCIENIDHIIFTCPFYDEERKKIQNFLKKHKLAFDIKEIFSNSKINIHVETFLTNIFKNEFKTRKTNSYHCDLKS